jgi:hypothetical protein
MLDILILSNAPGEVTTWVRPVVAALRQRFNSEAARISVILSPCPNAGGREAEIALAYPGVDRAQAAQHFWSFLLQGRTADRWDWSERGIVIFLGGDQIFPVLIGRRLGYRTLIYAEWEARWLPWIDRFALMSDRVGTQIPLKYQAKITVVGDLILEASAQRQESAIDTLKIGLLPGSKAQKLQMGLPFMLAIAAAIHRQRPEVEFFIPVAPSISLEYLAQFAETQHNAETIQAVGGTTATLIPGDQPLLQTASGLRIPLRTEFPAYDQLGTSTLCLTTIGANTAELAALGIPMIVVIPIYQLDAMRSWDGLLGIFARLPGVGTVISKGINWYFFKRFPDRKYAWPNIWAGREIVPELLGKITVEQVSNLVLEYLQHPEQLAQMRTNLAAVRGAGGAAEKIAEIVEELVNRK